jgi:sugar porter (SP) family MFS transporter
MEHEALTLRGYLVVFTAAISGILFGYDLCITTDALEPLEKALTLSTPQVESVVSIVMALAAVGALTGGPLSELIGRKRLLLVCAGLFTVGAIASGSAPSLAWLLLGRSLLGLAIGASGMVVAVYVGELSPSSMRGALVTVNELAVCAGCIIALGCGAALDRLDPAVSWRWMLAIGCVPSVALCVLGSFLPESPLWLRARGETARAAVAERQIWIHADPASVEMTSLVAASEAHRAKDELPLVDATAEEKPLRETPTVGRETPLWAFLRTLRQDCPERRMLLVSVFVGIGQNLCFSNATLYYSKTILSLSGVPSTVTEMAVLGLGVAKLLGVACSLCLIDRPRVGRRRLLLGGTIVQAVAAGIFAITAGSDAMSWGAIVLLIMFVIAWDLSWAPLLWVMTSELAPAEFRGISVGVSVAAFWSTSAIANQVMLSMLRGLGLGVTMGVVCALGVVCAVGVGALVPDTRGKTFQEIRELFQGRVCCRWR